MSAFGLGLSRVRAAIGATLVSPLLGSIDAGGWSALWASGTPPSFTPDTSPQTVNVTRAGFDATGATASFTEARTLTTRVRAAYPTQPATSPAVFTAATVALDDYLYATDSIAGVTNNATETSPKPVAAWMMPGRSLVGTSLAWELVAFHRDFRGNRQVACVQVQATDGTTTTAWQTVATTALSTLCEDANPVEVFRGTLDISALATGLVTLRAKVFPWVGGSGSVLDSADQTAAREFGPRYFYKDASRLAAPPLAYVASTGSDTTGAWSTTAATAAATSFLTVGGALAAMDHASRGTLATGGYLDGARIRIVDTVSLSTTGVVSARAQKVAAVIVERAPGTARASAIVTLAAAMRPRLGVGTLLGGLTEGALRFTDVTVSRTVNTTFLGEATNQLNVQFMNATIANGSTAGSWLSNSHDWFFGVALTGFNGNLGLLDTARQHRMLRGLTCDIGSISALEAWATVGCTLTGANGCSPADIAKGAIFYANRYPSPKNSIAPISGFGGTAAGDLLNNLVVVQNLIEETHTTSATNGLSIDADNQFASSYNVIVAYNTVTGYAGLGRWNIFYDENTTATTRRTHRLTRMVGNIAPQLNQKGDIFVASVQGATAEAPNRLGHFPLHHGVGAAGNLFLYRVASGTFLSEYQLYAGLKSEVGTDPNAPLYAMSAVWTDYRGTTGSGGTPTAGAGGGSYTLVTGSPAKAKVAAPGLGYDLGGSARPASGDSAGAYA